MTNDKPSKLDRRYAKLARQQYHLGELKALGYTGRTLHPLRMIENAAHRAAEQYCNGEITEVQYSDIKMRLSNRVAGYFDGKLPKGFFINSDPRGYALKLDYKLKPMPLSYQDWGKYGILAPPTESF